MGRVVGQRRFLRTLAATVAALGAAVAGASPPPAAMLEVQARAEFAQAGSALRKRLEKEAAGDLVGARIAAQEADAHRYRFLDLKRELGRLSLSPLTSPSVAAPRDPFRPDSAFLPPPSWATRRPPKTPGKNELASPEEKRAWDMYRRHGLQEPDRQSSQDAHGLHRLGDMYTTSVLPAFPPGAAATARSEEVPRAPFYVYRERAEGGSLK